MSEPVEVESEAGMEGRGSADLVDRTPLGQFPKGQSGNPTGKAKVESKVPDALGGAVTAVRMRKVLGQHWNDDEGPTEKSLREWLKKDPRGYIAECERREKDESGVAEKLERLEQLEAELEGVRAADSERKSVRGGDAGSARAIELIDRILAGQFVDS